MRRPGSGRAGWGAKIIDRLAKDLTHEFPTIRGFSTRNLKYMRAFAKAWPERQIVQDRLAQLTWFHQIALLEKLKSSEERLVYAAATVVCYVVTMSHMSGVVAGGARKRRHRLGLGLVSVTQGTFAQSERVPPQRLN